MVHLRCGDVLRTRNPEYGFLPFAYYLRAIPHGVARVLVVGNFDSGPGSKSGRGNFPDDVASAPLCARILAAFIAFLTQHRPDIGSVREVSRGFNRDFWLLAHARVVVASVSTYSFWAALVNRQRGGVMVLPRCHLLLRCGTPKLRFTAREEAELPVIRWQAEPSLIPSVLLRKLDANAVIAVLQGTLHLPGEQGHVFNRTMIRANCRSLET